MTPGVFTKHDPGVPRPILIFTYQPSEDWWTLWKLVEIPEGFPRSGGRPHRQPGRVPRRRRGRPQGPAASTGWLGVSFVIVVSYRAGAVVVVAVGRERGGAPGACRAR